MHLQSGGGQKLRQVLKLGEGALGRIVCGPADGNLRLVEKLAGVEIAHRADELIIAGPEEQVARVANMLQQLGTVAQRGRCLQAAEVERAWRILCQESTARLEEIFLDTVLVVRGRGRTITPLGYGQKKYIEAIRKHDVVFAIGPAGTGKTYLAMAMAVEFLNQQKVRRLVITRPAVEAGEKLGFLPGDLEEKVNPYLRPLYDALNDMMEISQVQRLMERGLMEVAPLAFMRGRTLNDCFVILDEAQNTTSEQMKMFLTRLGYDSKAVITGDITQIDLPADRISGLVEANRLLRDIEGIAFCYFSEQDVVRHPLVSEIIRAYQKAGAGERGG
jgi:phosphate starvation-inducible PhoH-like protein